ncbi:MAG: hypothetical protein CMJ48_06595 [Planctomycetaceae bacterium]|nr:hypothetical protein [Planctomycetaceae bacterium]
MQRLFLFGPLFCVGVGCFAPDWGTAPGESIHNGALGPFILESVAEYGATPVNTVDLPPLEIGYPQKDGTGKYFYYTQEDESVEISVPTTSGPGVLEDNQQALAFLKQAFGEPRRSKSGQLTFWNWSLSSDDGGTQVFIKFRADETTPPWLHISKGEKQ